MVYFTFYFAFTNIFAELLRKNEQKKEKCSEKLRKIHSRTPESESLFKFTA